MKAYGPGLEKGNVMPGRPTNFMIDSTKTGPAPITVNVTGNISNQIDFEDWSCLKCPIKMGTDVKTGFCPIS